MRIMPYRVVLWSIIFAALVSVGVRLVRVRAQAPVPPVAEPIANYLPPDFHAVLAGKAPIRVLVISKQTMLAWKGDDEVRATSVPDDAKLYTAKAGEMVGLVRAAEEQSCWLRQDGKNFCAVPSVIRLESDKPFKVWTPKPDAWTTFTGPLIITPTADRTFSVVRQMPLEEYLRNVVPAEMPASFQPQALRAQAIIARTYALAKLGRHADEGADVCSIEHCQMFAPDSKRTAATDAAVADTRGEVLMCGNKLAQPYYHSNCGGVTDDAGLLWGPEYAQPYLCGTSDLPNGKCPAAVDGVLAADDPYCKGANSLHWMKSFSATEVDALVEKNLPIVQRDPSAQIHTVTNLAVEERTPHGRVARLRVEGLDAHGNQVSYAVFGDQVRWLFGTGNPGPGGLFSTLFDLTITKGDGGKPTGYTFHGAGRGHGIGLCQWGADGRAKCGQTYRQILCAYYPGTRLSGGGEK